MVCIYLTSNNPKYTPPNLKVPQIFKISDFELVFMCDVRSTSPHSQMSFVQWFFFAFTTGYMFHNNMFWMKANHVKKQFYLLVQQAGIF